MTSLFHVSDRPGIDVFHPRPSAYTDHPVVWAIEASRLANYLVPRECPRVCFRAGPDSTARDIAQLLAGRDAVVAVEENWRETIATAVLFVYAMPEAGFVLKDEPAQYWVNDQPVVPLGMTERADLPAAIAASGATLRYLPSLWQLHDRIAASTLVFSMIRMRNATPREAAAG